jgi:hypothetical protein
VSHCAAAVAALDGVVHALPLWRHLTVSCTRCRCGGT